MRFLLLLILMMVFSTGSRAAEYLDGYIIFQKNDTVKCKFKVGGFIKSTDFFDKLTIVTGQGEEQIFRAKDKKVLGYGFIEKGKQYHYLFIDSRSKFESGFYQRIVNGKYKLYHHLVTTAGYAYMSTNPIYVLFNPAGQSLRFEPCTLCPWKKKLRELLKDDQNALEALEDARRANIPLFVMDINRG